MPAPGQYGIKLNPYRAHFATKEQKTGPSVDTVMNSSILKRPMGMTHDRATH